MYRRGNFDKDKHGRSRSRIYRAWYAMMERCYNSKSDMFHHYGKRGIRVCRRWHRFTIFLADMGERPKGMTLDRKNNNRSYTPGNCRWATITQQNRNRRGNKLITAFGETRTMVEWCAITGLSHVAIRNRLKHGLTPEKAIDPRRGLLLGKKRLINTRWGPAIKVKK